MGNIIRFYNQNRKAIWITVIAIIFIIIAIHVLNDLTIKNNEQKRNASKNIVTEKDYKENPDISVTIPDTKVKEEKELIVDQFIRYCNAKEFENAYNLISKDCKNELYPNVNLFIQNYINNVFNTTKLYSKEIYVGNIYKVKLYEDILSTGNVSNSTVEDYYTIVKEDNNTKLNIGGYIGNVEINKDYSDSNLNINILSKKIFKEYEEYKIEVENKTNNQIMIDGMKNTKSTYLLGKENVKYYALIHENTEDDLSVPAKVKKTITIKFNKSLTKSNVNENGIVFSNIVLDNKNNTNIQINF